MTTPLALAQARAAQAAADREAAEQALLAVMAAIDPRPTMPVIEGILPRRFEALLEGAKPHRALAQAYTAFRRAQRAERKTRSVANWAQFEPMPSAGGSSVPSSSGLSADEVLAGIRERRAA